MFGVYDVEALSIEKNTDLAMIGFMDAYGYKYYINTFDFLKDVLQRKNDGKFFYGHYAGKYDALFILEEFFNNDYFEDWDVNIFDSNGRIIGLLFKKGKIKINFADSYSLFRTSLNEVGKAFLGIEKKEHDHNEEYIINEKNIEYNKIDCEILYKSLKIFFDEFTFNLGPKFTIGSYAINIFNKNFNRHKLMPHGQEAEKFIREAYAGGRTEIFKTKLDHGYCYDVNSMYPSCMMEKMPLGPAVYVNERNKENIGFYFAKVKTPPKMYIPVLFKKMDGLKFPAGSFSGIWDGAELDFAEEMGYEINIEYGYEFLESDYIFNDYVEHYFKMKADAKKSGDPTKELIAKLFLNNLYGKFAERREKETFTTEFSPDSEMYNEDFGIFKVKKMSQSKNIIPAISAHITALGRIKLYKYFLKFGIYNIAYCDTDSVETTIKIEDSPKLGEMKLEYEFKNADFILPKTYKLFNITKNKIINKEKGFEIRDGKKLENGSIKLAGYKSALQSIGTIDDKYVFLKHIIYNKENKKVYDKRKVIGTNTQPLEVIE